MKQLLVLSGKGGTGKTTLSSAFISYANINVFADCDVDAPNLHLVTKQESEPKVKDYFGMDKAVIDPDRCIGCGVCAAYCRFDAIIESGEICSISPYACEGCAVCEAVCSSNAIQMQPAIAGELKLYVDADSVFSTAELEMGSGTSGKLVTRVKLEMRSAVSQNKIITDLAIIDGSPGIGCPVIASISGVNVVLIVAEPTLSGISDMQRIAQTAKHFGVPTAVCVNKYDINIENTEKIKTFCSEEGLTYLGEIPFDPCAVKAVNQGVSIIDIDCPAGEAAKEVFDRTVEFLYSEK